MREEAHQGPGMISCLAWSDSTSADARGVWVNLGGLATGLSALNQPLKRLGAVFRTRSGC